MAFATQNIAAGPTPAAAAEGTPEPVMLIIADISGYTSYMTANAKTLAHSQSIITELIKTIIREIELPLEVAKLEGDAVFFYCRKQNLARPWGEAKRTIGQNLLKLFGMFSARVSELSASTTCECKACSNIKRLQLKVVVHSGEALFHRVFNFQELAGVDVIAVHRLLKNSVKANQYLLLTDAARRDIEFVEPLPLSESVETYEDIGRIPTFVYIPGAVKSSSAGVKKKGFGSRFAEAWKTYWILWRSPFANRMEKFNHVESRSGRAGRIAFGVLTVVLSPIAVPVAALFIIVHALPRPGGQHVHRADGSCCGHH